MRKLLLFSLLITIISVCYSQQTQQRGFKAVDVVVDGKQTPLYKQSHALIIGISAYNNGWNALNGVKSDVAEVKKALEDNGFNVEVLQDATKEQIDKTISAFIGKYGESIDNRLLIYYAGHGYTVKTSYGDELGYIVPVNAPNPTKDLSGFKEKAIEMAQIEIYAKRIQSKHALFLFDACFAGSLFDMRSPVTEAITYKTTQQVRQFITSGSAEEQVPDVSIFRKQFVTALSSDEADYDKDGFLTGSELGQFLQTKVVNYSYNAQHPQYGKIRNPKLDKGDFVFELKTGKPATTTSNPTATPAKTIVVEEIKIRTYGTIEIRTEIDGDLYIDGAFIKKATASRKLTLKNIETGSHTVEIRGAENWKNTTLVYKDQTAYLEAKSDKKPGAGNVFPLNADFIVPVAGIDIKMRGLQGGAFTMGNSDNEADETPHKVTIGNFAMMKYEVTVAEFKKFVDDSGYQTDADKRTGYYGSWIYNGTKWEQKNGVNWQCGVDGSVRSQSEYNHPVIHVSWSDAVAYAQWLSKKTGQTWRLPTEAEWEYAAKGGQNFKFAGSDSIDNVSWYEGNSGMKTHSVGEKSPNSYGLYDMSGNVWEWCSDWYDKEYYKTGSTNNPQGASSGSYRVYRGGGWTDVAKACRAANRDYRNPDNRNNYMGFRLVLVP